MSPLSPSMIVMFGDVEAAELIDAIGHPVQAVGHVDAGVAPKARMDAVGGLFAFEKLVALERPYQPAVGARDQLVAERFDKAAPRIFERLPIRERYLCNRRPICRARRFGRVFHLLSLQFPAGSKNLSTSICGEKAVRESSASFQSADKFESGR